MFSSLIKNTCIIMTGMLQVMMMRMMGRSVLKNIEHDKGYYTNQRCIELIETEQNCRLLNFNSNPFHAEARYVVFEYVMLKTL